MARRYSLVSGVLCKCWPVSWLCISVCLALVCSIVLAAVKWQWEPCGRLCQAIFLVSSCIVVPCACSGFITLLAWHIWVQFFCSLVVLGVPYLPPPPPNNFSFHWAIWLECDGCLRGAGCRGLVAWLRVVKASGVFQCLGLWLRLQPTRLLGHLPSISDLGVILIILPHWLREWNMTCRKL